LKILFVFDDILDKKRAERINFGIADKVSLFPITCTPEFTDNIIDIFSKSADSVNLILSGTLINQSAEKIRGDYINFIAAVPESIKFSGRNLKEFFRIDATASLWWFSLVAEKNVYKTEAFNNLAQLDAIVETIRKDKFTKLVVASKNSKLISALFDFSGKNGITFRVIAPNVFARGLHEIAQFRIFFLVKHLAVLFLVGIKIFIEFVFIKAAFKNRKLQSFKTRGQMVITYFPNIDTGLAEQGIFSNRYYPYIQQALESADKDIIWLAMLVKGSGVSFIRSIGYAKKIIEKGNLLYFFEEFMDIRMQVLSLLFMLKQALRFFRVEKTIKKFHIFNGYNFYPLCSEDWFSSFCGQTGYKGLIYYRCFGNIFKAIKPLKCLYCCEMHAWEAALASAKYNIAYNIELFAYQHATVSRMLLNYFKAPMEIRRQSSYAAPLPNKILCNGPLTLGYMMESGYPTEMLSAVEAVRYYYLRSHSSFSHTGNQDNTIIIALSIGLRENISLLRMAYSALKNMPGITVWVKPHPFLAMDRVFKGSFTDKQRRFFKVKRGILRRHLEKAKIAIAGESSAAIEALAAGCYLVNISTPEWINMSPLKGFDSGLIKTADSAEELADIVKKLMNVDYKRADNASIARRVIDEFFCLDYNSEIPSRMLEALSS